MFEDRWCLWEPPLLPQRWFLLEYSCFDQFPYFNGSLNKFHTFPRSISVLFPKLVLYKLKDGSLRTHQTRRKLVSIKYLLNSHCSRVWGKIKGRINYHVNVDSQLVCVSLSLYYWSFIKIHYRIKNDHVFLTLIWLAPIDTRYIRIKTLKFVCDSNQSNLNSFSQ